MQKAVESKRGHKKKPALITQSTRPYFSITVSTRAWTLVGMVQSATNPMPSLPFQKEKQNEVKKKEKKRTICGLSPHPGCIW